MLDTEWIIFHILHCSLNWSVFLLLQVKARQLEHAKKDLERDLDQLKDQLDQQKEHRIEQEKRVGGHTLPNHSSHLINYSTIRTGVEMI